MQPWPHGLYESTFHQALNKVVEPAPKSSLSDVPHGCCQLKLSESRHAFAFPSHPFMHINLRAECEPAMLPRFKCWCAGIPWGLSLPPEALRSRTALAAVLETAFHGEDLQLEAGRRLHAILLDGHGQISVFPPDKSDEPWQALAPSITRVYTCRA